MSKIGIVSDSGLFQEGVIKALQNKLTDYEIVAYCPSQYQTIHNKSALPDLLIIEANDNLDFKLFDHIYKNQKLKVSALIHNIDNELLRELFKLELQGYFSNEMSINELTLAIKNILNGKHYIHPDLSYILLNDYRKSPYQGANQPVGILTEREWDVLQLIVKGNNNSSISELLSISEKTVKSHVSSILNKLQVPDRLNAVLYAIKMKWFVL